MKSILSILAAFCLVGCSALHDAATSIAADIEQSVGRLGAREGSIHVISHDAKPRVGSDARMIKVQFDKVGALIVWYLDGEGKVLESGSTTYHSRFVDTPETIIVDRPIDSPLKIEIQRRNGRAVVARVL